MESDQLLAFFKRGLIPGPDETEEAFLKRAHSRTPLPNVEWEEIADALLKRGGFYIDWLPITYSCQKLLPWEAAVFWMQESGESLLQLRPSLKTRPIWGNSRFDILMHEAIHAAREAFDEPQFEEFIAYTMSTSCWKRWLGPFFVAPWEFPLLTLALFILPFLFWVSIPLLLFFFGRFLKKGIAFYRLKKKLPFPILLCLTDREIQQQGKLEQRSEAKQFPSLRHQLIEILKKSHEGYTLSK